MRNRKQYFVIFYLISYGIVNGDNVEQSLFKKNSVTIPNTSEWWGGLEMSYKIFSLDNPGLIDCSLTCSISESCNDFLFDPADGSCFTFKEFKSKIDLFDLICFHQKCLRTTGYRG